MEVTKEQEIERLNKAGIEYVDDYLNENKLVYSNEYFLIYEDEDKNIDCITFDNGFVLSVHGDGNLFVHGSINTVVDGEGETYFNGKGAVYLHRFIAIPSPKSVNDVAVSKGWYDGITPDNMGKHFIPAQLALITSEASEALEVYRGLNEEQLQELGKNKDFSTELADIVLRVLDLSGFLGIDIQTAIKEKHEKNKERPYRHGNKLI